MRIDGLQKMTLLDFPGKVACTVFTGGCNFRCPFCHNALLVTKLPEKPDYSEDEILSFLEKRTGLLDGVAITGGEPLLNPDIADFIRKIRSMGYAVKLDTNGSFPERLKAIVGEGLVDYVAMDIKHAPNKYNQIANRKDFSIEPILESVAFLKEGRIPYEFRTTVIREFHKEEDFISIGKWLSGADAYILHSYKDSERVISPGFHAYPKDDLKHFCSILKPDIKKIEIRGIEE